MKKKRKVKLEKWENKRIEEDDELDWEHESIKDITSTKQEI